MTEVTLIPAYGRTYSTDEEMIKDWNEGKDFKIYPTGPYTSIRDLTVLKNKYARVAITSDFWMYKVV